MALWGGRFSKETDKLVRQFNDSIGFDQRLWQEDIDGSIAWAKGLVGGGVLDADEAGQIVAGLEQVRAEWLAGTFEFAAGDEDIHTANERRLTELIGDLGGKLHTGRSRNDQVGTDFRLWTKKANDDVMAAILDLQNAMIENATQNLNLPMPGYTHLQHAQPVTWGHWMLSHFWPLQRDRGRFEQAKKTADELPLGSAALAGTAFPIDRQSLATFLDFGSISQNSLDAVSNRDFVVDFLYASALLGVHLSRLSEQLVLFSSQEFGFVRLDDAFSTGSSIMPQKKNPDTLELTRGKSGRLLGHLVAMLTTLKGLPSTYDKDLQEDKEPIFDAYDTLMIVLPVMAGVIRTLKVQEKALEAQLEPGLLATELADYLVKKQLPFRQAHHIVGEVVQRAEDKGIGITDLSLAELQEISDLFTEDVTEAFSVRGALAARTAVGGVSPQALDAQVLAAKQAVS